MALVIKHEGFSIYKRYEKKARAKTYNSGNIAANGIQHAINATV